MLPSLVHCAKAAYSRSPSSSNTFKRAGKGLFGGKLKLFGNNVPESHQKTRRTWTPNIQSKNLYSATLDERIKMKVTVSALRDIDKAGGLDEYLMKRSTLPTLGETGLRLKQRVEEARMLQGRSVQEEQQIKEDIRRGIDETFAQTRQAITSGQVKA